MGTGKKRRKTSRPDLEPTLARIRALLHDRAEISEKHMFGGHCFFKNGHMVGGPTGNGDLMIRVGPDAFEDALAQPGARQMDFTGRPMRGFVFVAPQAYKTDTQLHQWLERGIEYAKTLPPKR